MAKHVLRNISRPVSATLPKTACVYCKTHAPRTRKMRCYYCHMPYTKTALAEYVLEILKR